MYSNDLLPKDHEYTTHINEYNQLFRFNETKFKVNQINVAQIVTRNKLQ